MESEAEGEVLPIETDEVIDLHQISSTSRAEFKPIYQVAVWKNKN